MDLNLSKIALALGTVMAGAAAVSTSMVGCGGDDTAVTADSGARDGTVDVAVDGPGSDDGSQTEAGTDGGGGGDADSSTPSDANDASDVQQYDVPPLGQYPHSVDEAYCVRMGNCCLVQPSQWNLTGDGGCTPIIDEFGGFRGLAEFNAALDSGLVTYNQAAAANCLQEISTLNCGVLTAQDIVKIQNDCFSAMQGTLGVDAGPCVNALECQSGEYCQLATDGGPGRCATLQGIGQPCNDTVHSTDCTYLGNGNPSAYCDPGDGSAPPTCASSKPLDAGCNYNPECQSGACNWPVCVDSIVFSDPGVANGVCAYFTIKDAGTD